MLKANGQGYKAPTFTIKFLIFFAIDLKIILARVKPLTERGLSERERHVEQVCCLCRAYVNAYSSASQTFFCTVPVNFVSIGRLAYQWRRQDSK